MYIPKLPKPISLILDDEEAERDEPIDLISSSDSSFDDDDNDDFDVGDDFNDSDDFIDSDDFNNSDEDKVDDVDRGTIYSDFFRKFHLPPIVADTTVGAFSFFPDPNINIIALGLSNGVIKMYPYDDEDQKYLREIDDVHLNKVVVLEFDKTGKYIYSASEDNNVSVSDVETGKLKVCFEEAHTAGSFVTALSFIDENVFATGGKDGVVNVWDVRANGCRFSLKKSEDSINSMITINDSNNQPTVACTSDDGTLTLIDLSTKKIVIQSEPYSSELTSCVTLEQNAEVICGTGEGSLIIFNAGDFSEFNEEFPCFDKYAAVTRLVPLTENVVINALDNGYIGATHLFPNYHLGIIGRHKKRVNIMRASPDGKFIAATTSFSVKVAFWYTGFIHIDQKRFKKRPIYNDQ